MLGFFSRFYKISVDGLPKLIIPIERQIDLNVFSCSVSWAIPINSDRMISLFVPAKINPKAKADASPVTELLALRTSFNFYPTVSFPEAKAVNPSPRQAPCIITSFWL